MSSIRRKQSRIVRLQPVEHEIKRIDPIPEQQLVPEQDTKIETKIDQLFEVQLDNHEQKLWLIVSDTKIN